MQSQTRIAVSVFAVGLVLATVCTAQSKQQDRQFEIVGQDGDSVTVSGHLTYAYSPASVEDVYDGILLTQGSGTTKVQWTRIKHIEIAAGESRKIAIAAQITLSDGKTISGKLHYGNLRGHTSLGEFNASIGDLRSITPLSGNGK